MTLSEMANILDASEYPKTWADYIGQDDAKRLLRVAAKSAKLRHTPLDHVLIAHPEPGVGKTALAGLIAREMDREVRVTAGQISKDQARVILGDMIDGDVWLIDEFHQLMDSGRKNAEWILHLLQDGVLPGPFGMEEQPKITIIAATTDPQKLPPAILSRFPLRPQLESYSREDAAFMAYTMAKRILEEHGMPELSDDDALLLADAADGNPRKMKNLLGNLRDLTLCEEIELIEGRYDIAGMLAFAGLTPDGLDKGAQDYLVALARVFGGTAGERALDSHLKLPGGVKDVESALMKRNLLAKTSSGRTLTKAGIQRAKELAA